MPFDIACDNNTGDWVPAPNGDYMGVIGQAEVQQRMMTRLRMRKGAWLLDPTGGQLGSRLYDALRLPTGRALIEAEAMVREALDTMFDIDVLDVRITMHEDTPSGIDIEILYQASFGDEQFRINLQVPNPGA